MRISEHKLLIKILPVFLGILLLAVTVRCSSDDPVRRDLSEIKKRGRLVAMTGYSATSYFIYKGQPMGYEYELLTRLAEHLDLELQIILEDNIGNMFLQLNRGDCDIIAHSLTVTKDRKERISFTENLFTTRQVLVQRKPSNYLKMKRHEINAELIRNPIELIGKSVYVKANSSHYQRLLNLSDEIGGEIKIVEVGGDTTSEQLIQAVSDGGINYTVADKHVAMINQAYFRNIDVKTAISLPQQIAWAVRKNSPRLKKVVDNWILAMKDSTDFYVIYNKYFKNRTAYVRRVRSEYLSLTGGKISKYDDYLKEQAKEIGWDWRLLASLIYQESQFDPRSRSWSGAVGLMQILPRIGRKFGAKNLRTPKDNIRAGVKFIDWLNEYWKEQIADEQERIKFILASYNVGIGHVQDARRLADKYGKNQNVWEDNVAYFTIRLSEEKYYSDEVVEFGYCRGLEPVNYVREILQRFDEYRKLIVA